MSDLNLFDGDAFNTDATDKKFPVKLTASKEVKDSGGRNTWYYEWTEQSFDPETGYFLDMDSPRKGDTTNGPFMVELNNLYVPTPLYVWATLRGVVNGDLYYEFEVPGLTEIIRVTGPKNASGYYPAVIEIYNSVTNSWTDGDAVWFVDPNG